MKTLEVEKGFAYMRVKINGKLADCKVPVSLIQERAKKEVFDDLKKIAEVNLKNSKEAVGYNAKRCFFDRALKFDAAVGVWSDIINLIIEEKKRVIQ